MTKLGLLGRIVGGLGLACVALIAVGAGPVYASGLTQSLTRDMIIFDGRQIASAPSQIASSGCVASPSQIAEPLRLLLDRRAEGTIVSPSKTAAVRPLITWQILPDEGGELMSIAEIMSPGGIGHDLPAEIDIV